MKSTFFKLTMAFICFGMLPLLLIGILFIVRYFGTVETVTEKNYSLLGYYISKNVEDLFESADDSMAYAYDYKNEEYNYLYEVLKDETLSSEKKENYINSMLYSMMLQNENISSIYFVTPDNTIYSVFYEQGKLLKDDLVLDTKDVFSTQDSNRSLMFLSTVSEEKYCINSSDYVFSLVRNYMDASNVESIQSRILGTIYVNIKVDQVEKVTRGIDFGLTGEIYILNKNDNSYIYSSDSKYYDSKTDPLNGYYKNINQATGSDRIGSNWLFYSKIGDTDNYVVIRLDENEVMSTYFKNRGIMFLVLAFTVFVVLVLYFIFSGKMSEPARRLKKAMQQVQKGNLAVHVEVKNKDEMGYLSEGFNKMVKDLQYYIEEVYVAKIYQKEAELQALKMQIQPHYLYNTLDVIRMTALENDDLEAASLIESLSKQLRYVISTVNDEVPLYMELDSIKEYFVIAKARHDNRISVNINVSEKDKNLKVVKLILQPAVENAIKHGLINKKDSGVVDITVKRFEEYLEIVVMDNGIGISNEKTQNIKRILDDDMIDGKEKDLVGVGLKNVYDRIKKRCGEEYGFNIISYEKMGTIITYKLPIWEGEPNVESSTD